MDQGIAGLVGALTGGLIGITGTLGAARIAGRDQRRTQHEHWRRQVRRDAYGQFITKTARALRAGEAAHEAARNGLLERDHYAAVTAAAADVEEAYSLVQLEGPEEVGSAADEVNSQIQGWKYAVGWLLEEGSVPRERALQRSAEASHLGTDRLDDFTELCRNLLDDK